MHTEVKVQNTFAANPSPASELVPIRPAITVSTMPMDICPTCANTIGHANFSVSFNSERMRIASAMLRARPARAVRKWLSPSKTQGTVAALAMG